MSYADQKNSRAGPIFGPRHAKPAPANPAASALGPVFRRRSHDERDGGRSSLLMHNLVVDGHRTTVRLEPVIWDALLDIARDQEVTVHALVSAINRRRTASSLSSAIRAHVVVYLSTGLRDAAPTRSSQARSSQDRLRVSGILDPLRTGK